MTKSDAAVKPQLVGWLHRLPLEELSDHARPAWASRVPFVAVLDEAHRSAPDRSA